MAPQIIHFDYDFSPVGQKTKLLLSFAGVDYKKVDQPLVLPRKDLEALGITYRRIPVLAVGKDVYVDSKLIIDVALATVIKSGAIATTSADKAYEAWGAAVFDEALGVIPTQALSDEFIKDRQTIFPIVARKDFASLRPSAISGLQSRLREIEDVFLQDSKGPFIGGEKPSLADVHVIWGVRWALNDLGAGQDAAVGKEAFPKVWKLIESLPPAKPEILSSEDAIKTIKEGEYTAKGPSEVLKGDPLGIKAGTKVTIESFDAEPKAHPQSGKLYATGPDEVVIEVDHGVRLHFPRIGYIVRAESSHVTGRSSSKM